jgi:hypothetical protein
MRTCAIPRKKGAMKLYDPERRWRSNAVAESSGVEGSEAPSNLEYGNLIDHVRALEAEKLRLQALVCHLLYKNEQFRSRNH